MAWVRIHEGAMGNLKIMRLSNGAFRLWIRGLCYCQTHLTDGLIPREALKFLDAKRADVDMLAAVLVEGKSPLWETVDGFGFKVHDYMEWNDSREVILKKREGGRARVRQFREAMTSEQRQEVDQRNALRNAHTPCGVVSSSSDLSTIQNPERESEGKPQALARGPRQAGRIFLHRWQLDVLIDTLGPHAEHFGLDEWLHAVNAQIAGRALPRDPWKFVQDELHAELGRRGLAVAEPSAAAPTNKRIAGLMAGGEAFLKRAAERRTS